MFEKDVTVVNKLGIHARPAGSIVRAASTFKSKVELVKDGNTADAKSIMNVMMLAASKGTVISVRADGEDEQEAVQAVISLFENKFNEE
ncbi:MAG: HPr family phosphocarrier protein [Chitinispirillales bacterium]|jgi:phosphocarrier protein|nr:HPr family phosphocarrier protein [Chitinispirillales bacterium]